MKFSGYLINKLSPNKGKELGKRRINKKLPKEGKTPSAPKSICKIKIHRSNKNRRKPIRKVIFKHFFCSGETI
jgi:hypothetical protein